MLTGEFLHSVDAKGRVFVPAKLRESLGDTFMLAKNVDGCLSLYQLSEWKRLNDKLSTLPDSQTRPIKRFLFTFAADVTPDGQGRITLPQNLREYAGLEKEVAFLGVGDHAELWALDRWNAMKSGDSLAEIEAMMKELGL